MARKTYGGCCGGSRGRAKGRSVRGTNSGGTVTNGGRIMQGESTTKKRRRKNLRIRRSANGVG